MNLVRLIDADALMKIVDSEIERVEEEMRDAEKRPNLYTDEFRKHKSYTVAGMAHIAQDILEAPTVDAVPVVRCKDCKHWQPSEYGVVEQPYCKHLGYKEETGLDIQIGNENDYCSFGERKGDE